MKLKQPSLPRHPRMLFIGYPVAGNGLYRGPRLSPTQSMRDESNDFLRVHHISRSDIFSVKFFNTKDADGYFFNSLRSPSFGTRFFV